MTPPSRPSRPAIPRWPLWVAAGILAASLFIGGPGAHPPRSLNAAWDLGHILAFGLWSHLLLTRKEVREISPSRQWLGVLLFCLVAGGATEWLQSLLGRSASLGDLFRDVVGGVLALSWHTSLRKTVSPWMRRTLRVLAVSIALVAIFPLAAALGDEAIARAQFPVLSDFETPFEKDRWKGNARFSIDRSVARRGNASLRVEMDTATYSGIFLVYFPGNWEGYRFFRLEVYNPSPEGIWVTCRIHDRRHEEGERLYEDRYNRRFLLPPGWNGLRIDLDEVAAAPAGRRMDLAEVRAVGLFASSLPAPRTLFLDYVRLE